MYARALHPRRALHGVLKFMMRVTPFSPVALQRGFCGKNVRRGVAVLFFLVFVSCFCGCTVEMGAVSQQALYVQTLVVGIVSLCVEACRDQYVPGYGWDDLIWTDASH